METFHAFINNIENSIKFRVETEVDGSLSFFDVLVPCENSGKLRTAFYIKPTHTTRYLNYNSNHILAKKIGLIKTLLFRATSFINTRAKDKAIEVKHVYDALRKNGYPEWLINKTKKSFFKKREMSLDTNTNNKCLVGLPYIEGITKKIEDFKK